MKPSCLKRSSSKVLGRALEWIVPVQVEIKMYHKVFRFPGTADILLLLQKSRIHYS
jgi:hypothetical protein